MILSSNTERRKNDSYINAIYTPNIIISLLTRQKLLFIFQLGFNLEEQKMRNTLFVVILFFLLASSSYPQRIPYKINELPPYGITYEDALNKWGKPTREGRPTFLEYKQDEYSTLFYFKPATPAVINLESIHFWWGNISEEED